MQLLLFFGCSPSAESVLLNFVLYLFRRICHKNAWLRNGARHLSAESLQRREKFVVKACWLGSLDFTTNISCHSEVRILVNTAGDKARNVLVPEKVRETAWKARSCLDSRVCSFSTVVWKLKAENSSEGCHVDVPLEATHIRVHGAHVSGVQADESVLRIEANC